MDEDQQEVDKILGSALSGSPISIWPIDCMHQYWTFYIESVAFYESSVDGELYYNISNYKSNQ